MCAARIGESVFIPPALPVDSTPGRSQSPRNPSRGPWSSVPTAGFQGDEQNVGIATDHDSASRRADCARACSPTKRVAPNPRLTSSRQFGSANGSATSSRFTGSGNVQPLGAQELASWRRTFYSRRVEQFLRKTTPSGPQPFWRAQKRLSGIWT